jgi:hypothetical protein
VRGVCKFGKLLIPFSPFLLSHFLLAFQVQYRTFAVDQMRFGWLLISCHMGPTAYNRVEPAVLLTKRAAGRPKAWSENSRHYYGEMFPTNPFPSHALLRTEAVLLQLHVIYKENDGGLPSLCTAPLSLWILTPMRSPTSSRPCYPTAAVTSDDGKSGPVPTSPSPAMLRSLVFRDRSSSDSMIACLSSCAGGRFISKVSLPVPLPSPFGPRYLICRDT